MKTLTKDQQQTIKKICEITGEDYDAESIGVDCLLHGNDYWLLGWLSSEDTLKKIYGEEKIRPDMTPKAREILLEKYGWPAWEHHHIMSGYTVEEKLEYIKEFLEGKE